MAKTQKKSTEKDNAATKPAGGTTKPSAGTTKPSVGAKKPSSEAKKPPAAKGKAPAAGAARKPATSAATSAPQVPLIDTNLAASAAASMIRNRALSTGTAQGGANQPATKESASFKSLKDSLSKSGSGLGGTFGTIGTQKKSGQNFGGGKQVGRNQTFGADVNRTGVPRRTGGG